MYNQDMTLTMALKAKDGLLVAADGLSQRYNEDRNLLEPLTDVEKIFNFNDYVVMMFSGNFIGEISDLVFHAQMKVKTNKGTMGALEVARFIGPYITAEYPKIVKHEGGNLDVIIAGYELVDSEPTETAIYKVSNLSDWQVYRAKKQYMASGHPDITLSLCNILHDSTKSFEQQNLLALLALGETEITYKNKVGGKYRIKHITQKGIEIVSISEIEKAMKRLKKSKITLKDEFNV